MPEISDQFIDAFPSSNSEARVKLKLVLDELESIPHSFCGSAWLNSHHFLFASSQVESVLGYSRDMFFNNGMMFIHSITPSQHINPIYQKANDYIKRMEYSGLGLKYPEPHMVEAALRKRNDRPVEIRHICTFLDCNGADLINGPFLALGIWQDMESQASEELNEHTLRAREILIKIREAYWELFPLRFATAQSYFVKESRQPIVITPKEKQVLILLSSGHTTKEIGIRLDISFHTVESHRKHLIKKFEVKNSVELLSKVNAILNSEASK